MSVLLWTPPYTLCAPFPPVLLPALFSLSLHLSLFGSFFPACFPCFSLLSCFFVLSLSLLQSSFANPLAIASVGEHLRRCRSSPDGVIDSFSPSVQDSPVAGQREADASASRCSWPADTFACVWTGLRLSDDLLGRNRQLLMGTANSRAPHRNRSAFARLASRTKGFCLLAVGRRP